MVISHWNSASLPVKTDWSEISLNTVTGCGRQKRRTTSEHRLTDRIRHVSESFVLNHPTSVRSILFCRSATSLAMSSSDSLSARTSSCQQQRCYCASHQTDRHEVRTGTYWSSTFHSFLLLQLLDGLQHASVVGDAVHPGVLLVFFGVDVPQQLNDIYVLLFLRTFLLRRGPETKKPRR